MFRPGRIPALVAVAALGLAPALFADTIYKTDGKAIEDIKIVEETILNVVYKVGNDSKSVPSEQVMEVSFDKMPRTLEDAVTALSEDDLAGALDVFDMYSDAQIATKNERRFNWAPAYATWMGIELRIALADQAGVTERADLLITNFPQSRYIPAAYLAKASAELQSNRETAAAATLSKFEALINDQSLSKRWRLECTLAQIQADQKASGDDKRERLGDIVAEAGREYPLVRSRAYVVEGETYLTEAEKNRDQKKAAEQRGKAREIFGEIVGNPQADAETLAGAFTGLGDCLFFEGLVKDDKGILKDASMMYLRVAVLYDGQSKYVPKALFRAMRCFDLMQDRARQRDMKRTLLTLYPNSIWTTEANKY